MDSIYQRYHNIQGAGFKEAYRCANYALKNNAQMGEYQLVT